MEMTCTLFLYLVTSVHIMSWISFPTPHESFFNCSLTLFTISIASTKLVMRLFFPDTPDSKYKLSFCGDEFKLPIEFPLSYYPHLLTISISPSSISVFLNQHLVSSIEYSSFKSGEKLLVTLGAGFSGDWKQISTLDETPSIVVHNASILSGPLSDAYLSSLYGLVLSFIVDVC